MKSSAKHFGLAVAP